eukprot:4926315-Amphidinium_carterae.1
MWSCAVQHACETLGQRRLRMGGDVSVADCCFFWCVALRVPGLVVSWSFESSGMIGKPLWKDNNSRLAHEVAMMIVPLEVTRSWLTAALARQLGARHGANAIKAPVQPLQGCSMRR